MQIIRPKKKLDQKFLGLGTVIEAYGNTAYKVDLPRVKNVYLVFYTSLLEPYKPYRELLYLEDPIIDTLRKFRDNIYKVKEILDCQRDSAKAQEYLIKQTSYLD